MHALLYNFIGFAILLATIGGAIMLVACRVWKWRPSFRLVLGILGGLALNGEAVWLISSVMEVSYEVTRNLIGFVLEPMVFGGTLVLIVCWVRNLQPLFGRIFKVSGTLAVLGFMVFQIGLALEIPYAYAFTLVRVRGATSVAGVPISKILDADFTRLVINGYFADWCGDYENLTVVRLAVPFDRSDYYFAYENRSRVLVPMTDDAAQRFPALMPPGDKLADLREVTGGEGMSVGHSTLNLPSKWFHTLF